MATVSETTGRRPSVLADHPESKEEFPEAPSPISVIEDQLRGKRLNDPAALEAPALLKAVHNAIEVSAAKGKDILGGLPHELYVENYKRRIGTDSIFRLVCSLYADCLQQEISLHLLAADNGKAMYDAEVKGSLIEYYDVYGSGKRDDKTVSQSVSPCDPDGKKTD